MRRRGVPILTVLGVGAALLYVGHRLGHVVMPFVLSFALAYVLHPLIDRAQVRGIRREVTVLGIYLGAALLLALLANTLADAAADQLALLQHEAPAYLARFKGFAGDLQARAARRLPFAATMIHGLEERALEPILEGAQHLPSYLLSFFPLLSLLFLIPFITFFLLLDGPASLDGAIQACPSRYVEQALHLISEIDHSLGAYLRGLVVVALTIAVTSFIGLVVLGVTQAFWISVLSGVSSFVPYLGAIVGMVVGGLIASFQFGTMTAGIKVVLLFFLIRMADEAILQPILAKRSVHLHPLIFLFCFMAGGELYGFLGLVFAVPVACILKALLQVGWGWYASASRLQPPEAIVPFT